MKILGVLGVLYLVMSFPAYSHEGHGSSNQASLMLVSTQDSRVEFLTNGNFRIIRSNAIPNHATGDFPNKGNPHTIKPQKLTYSVPFKPKKASKITKSAGYQFGVAVNGVPFDPGTAEKRAGWSIEALTGDLNLGLDKSNAHVQPNGLYHYHGIPWAMLRTAEKNTNMLIGYAADGFPIFTNTSRGKGFRSSYRVKEGERNGGPGGKHDGTYTEDWEYVEGLGDLDECNGKEYEGRYVYFLTEQFPFVPRCFVGKPSTTFQKRWSIMDWLSGQGRPREAPPPKKPSGPPPHKMPQ